MKNLLLIFLLIGCSNMSKNMVQEDRFWIRDGVHKKQSWSENWGLKHVSWYSELSLVFDLVIDKIDKKSKFYSWFSPGEQEFIDSCKSSYIVFSYSLDNDALPQSEFKKMLNDKGLDNFSVNSFRAQLKNHPVYAGSNLRLYNIWGFCSQKVNVDKISLTFPGFLEKEIY